MSIWRWIIQRFHLHSMPDPRNYGLEDDLHLTLRSLADQEGLREDDLTADLVARGLSQYYSLDDLQQTWETLTSREMDVAALACLGYTNPQIALRLGISLETVKSHLRSILFKFQLHSKGELRLVLAGWDFSGWMTER